MKQPNFQRSFCFLPIMLSKYPHSSSSLLLQSQQGLSSLSISSIRESPQANIKERFFLPLRLSCKESSTFLTKPLFNSLYDLFGSPRSGGTEASGTRGCSWLRYSLRQSFGIVSGACAHKGLPMIVYAIELRLFVGWRIESISYENAYKKILLPYRFCGDSHHAFAFPFVLCILPFAPQKP